MDRFEACHTCRRVYNDEYCLYCIHNYNLSVLKERDREDLNNYYLKEQREIHESCN